jgi:hypothetical protein
MRDRWGKGTGTSPSEKAPDSAAAKEAEAKVAAMIQERQRQDAELWGLPIQDPIKNPTTK